MRKTLAIFQASPRRLLTQLLIPFLLFLVAVASGDHRPCVRREVKPTTYQELRSAKAKIRHCTISPFTKRVQIKSQSSKMFVMVSPKDRRKVTAGGLEQNGEFSWLDITSYGCPNGDVIVRIKGVARENSLCFTRNGRLIQKEDIYMSAKCAFYESTVNNSSNIELRSAFDENHVIAFSHSGQRLRGGRYEGSCNSLQTRYPNNDPPLEDWHNHSEAENSSDTDKRVSGGRSRQRERNRTRPKNRSSKSRDWRKGKQKKKWQRRNRRRHGRKRVSLSRRLRKIRHSKQKLNSRRTVTWNR